MDVVALGLAKAYAGKSVRALAGPKSLNGRSVTALAPTFTKHPGNPILTQAASGAPSITWCWILDVTDHITSPLARYYMWFATDHDTGAGGIYLATSNSPLGPWTPRGLVYKYDDTSQTETPSVIGLPDHTGVRMLFQIKFAPGATGFQTTMQTTSANGRTGWAAAAIAADKPGNVQYPGDGHTGYVRPFWFGGRLMAYGLMGGTDYPHAALWYSDDLGATWTLDPRLLGYGIASTGDPTRRVDWLQCAIIDWRGQPWLIAGLRPKTSGGTIVPTTWIAGPLRADLRALSRKAVDITPPAQAWENNVLGSPLYALEADGELYLYYRGNGGQGGFGVALLDMTGA